MKKKPTAPRSMTLNQAARLVAERPQLQEVVARFRSQAAGPPLDLAGALIVAIASAFELGRVRGIEHSADRISGVARSLTFEAS